MSADEEIDIVLDAETADLIRFRVFAGNEDAVRESFLGAFSDDQIQEIERRLKTLTNFRNFSDLIHETLDFAGDDADELFECLQHEFKDCGFNLVIEETKIGTAEEEEAKLMAFAVKGGPEKRGKGET